MIKAAIIQSNYLPWKGYFDIIHDVDVFIFLDDVQYTKRDWRNRNKIKTPGGLKWISVPVMGSIDQMIYETKIDYSSDWMTQHKKMIHHSYAASKYYDQYADDILDIFAPRYENISELNISAIKKISALLGLDKEFINSKDLATTGRKDDKLIEICQEIGADCYLSGPAAKDYIVPEKFQKMKIDLEYKDYSGYPEYAQLWGTFDHYVSIIDLIFNCGERAPYHIWGWRNILKPC
ncbi:MAG: WbqC family protein [Methanothrix sp.]|nr:WbqC family protein [Methanothrix sp.]